MHGAHRASQMAVAEKSRMKALTTGNRDLVMAIMILRTAWILPNSLPHANQVKLHNKTSMAPVVPSSREPFGRASYVFQSLKLGQDSQKCLARIVSFIAGALIVQHGAVTDGKRGRT
jgi:hypothetical protein